MPTVSVANFENEDLLSSRLLSFITGSDQLAIGCDANGTKFVNSGNFGSSVGSLTDAELNGPSSVRSPLHRNGNNSTAVTMQDRIFNASPNDITSLNGFVSGSCTPPLSSIHPSSNLQSSYVSMRNQNGPPPYSAVASPCLSNKLNPGAGVQQLLGPNEYHSLQNSPFYSHYSMNGNIPAPLHRQLGGISPGPMGSMIPNGVSPRNGFYQDLTYSMNGTGMRTLTPANGGGCPQRELFPVANQNGTQCGSSIFGSGLLMQDRLHYYALAQKYGFVVGAELERVKENSCRSTSQSYGRIAAHFRHRYGETEAKTKATYLQIGVRVPSKDHVSEIVGKGGQKIKLIREETGALITTPGEHEEHVFIIEAPPEIAMRVAHHLTARAQEITQSKLAAGERRRGSTSSQPSNTLETNGLSSNYQAHNGSTNNLLTSSSSTSALIPLSSSVTNSPLHPTMGVLPSTTPNVTNGILRNPSAGGLFNSSQLSSLPSSPCTSAANTSQANGTGSLFLGSNTSGSRVLLARSRISVPQDMVGKIIGTQGSIITTIQKDTGTEIKSPPKEAARGPNATSEFEISAYQGLGLTSNQAAECRVQQAKQLIGHLVMRQLERRASEEIDETSGSSDEQRHVPNGPPSSTSKSAAWMWPDVAQMDSQEAREVLDRILAESKNKTRRVKELAAAAAVGGTTTGSSPGSGSMLGMLNPDSLHHNPGLFDPVDANDCSADFGLRDELNASGLFSPVNRFVKRNSSVTLVDESGFNRGSQAPCSPRTVGGFNLPASNLDLMNSYNPRLPTNRGAAAADMWGSNTSFNLPQSPLTHNNNNNTRTFDGLTSNPLHGYVNSTNSTNLFQSNGTSDTLRKQTSLTNGYACVKSSGFHESSNIFNFTETANGLSSGFASGGDLSPTTLMQTTTNAARLSFEPTHQTLARRHSDWVVPTEVSNFRSGLVPPEAGADNASTRGVALPSGGGFDFLKALDQLCLNSNPSEPSVGGGSLLTESLGSQTNSSNGSHVGVTSLLSSHCPPGFESIPPNSAHDVAISDGHCLSELNNFCASTSGAVAAAAGSWSEANDAMFLSTNEPVTTTDSVHSTSKLSVLQRLFHTNPSDDVLSTSAHLSSIWSPTIDCSSRVITSQQNHYPDQFLSSYFNPTVSKDSNDQATMNNNNNNNSGSEAPASNGGELNRMCGTIGEGRRRRQNPAASSSSDVDPIIPVSSSVIINSITEVA